MTPLVAFTGRQVECLTGLTRRTLRYWEETGVFRATHVDARERQPYRRMYTFADLVSLRTLALLRRKHKVPLDELRRVGQWLAGYHQAPWANVRFFVVGRHVVFPHPETGDLVAGKPLGQQVIAIDLEEIARATEADTRRLRERRPEDLGRITHHRYVLHNAPVVAGTRIPTSAIWNFHEAGYDTARILRAYPRLTPEDVEAALTHEHRRRSPAAA